jgi:LmbE family N-acetylglucosaminyl deacetylase
MRTMVVAPHPDDEILGCGGTLIRRKSEGKKIGLIIVTSITEEAGWDRARVKERTAEIDLVVKGLGVEDNDFFPLGFPTTRLDRVPMQQLIKGIGEAIKVFEPQEILLPYPGDAHSDHRIVFEAASACSKWFRYPSVQRVLVYETPSETDFGIDPTAHAFKPNIYVDISKYMETKLMLMKIYKSEFGDFPFPRSEAALVALGSVRGSQSGFHMAEAFMLLMDRMS